MHLETGHRSPNGITPPTLPTTRLVFDMEKDEDREAYNLLRVYVPHAGHYWKYDQELFEKHDVIEFHNRKDEEQINELINTARGVVEASPKLREKLSELPMLDVLLISEPSDVSAQGVGNYQIRATI